MTEPKSERMAIWLLVMVVVAMMAMFEMAMLLD